MKYNAVELIIKKRDGKKLSRNEIKYFVESYLAKKIPEYQMSSMLMAIFQQNMQPDEVQTLTEIYIESGEKINFPKSEHTIDKHSTGGVGDKISIVLAPIVAACGGKIPMISGRGLGHTGGTLDKLESIPGFRTDFSEKDFKKIIQKTGFSIISQSKKLVPADRRIYALRDVTGTVESLPLITASIMSKKIAEGAQNLVIDLKVGNGAFIKDLQTADQLADLLIKTGNKLGQTVSVIYTNMNSPLGYYIGNALEIKECIEYLQGKKADDIHQITKTLAVEMLLLSQNAQNKAEAEEKVENSIKNGSALKYFKKFIKAQAGDPNVCDDISLLPTAKYEIPITSDKAGWIKSINSQAIGYALIDINAGRKNLESKLNYATGAYLPKKIGDKIGREEKLGTVYCDNKDMGKIVCDKILASYKLQSNKVTKEKVILKKF